MTIAIECSKNKNWVASFVLIVEADEGRVKSSWFWSSNETSKLGLTST